MKTNIRNFAALPTLAAVLLLCGCAGRHVQDLVGKSGLAAGALYRQAESVVLSRDREVAPDCARRRVVRTVLETAPEVVVTPHGGYDSVPFTGSGTPSTYVVPAGQRYSRFVERWTLDRCGAEVAYRVTYRPDGPGTVVEAEPWK